ncbi:hypothetical protein Cfor_07545, partial [Coptotermes formosanus]
REYNRGRFAHNKPLHTAEMLNPPEVEGSTSHNAPNRDYAKECPIELDRMLKADEAHSVRVAPDLENGINSENSDEGNSLLLAAKVGDLKRLKEIFEKETNVPINYRDGNGNTLLHLAAMSGSADSVKYLIENGADLLLQNKNKYTALYVILNNTPNGENLLIEILNENIEVTELTNGLEELEVSLKILCPKEKNKMAVADRLYTSHTDNKNILRHPVLKTLIHVRWEDCRYLMWYRLIIFFLYLSLLTVFVFYQDGDDANLARYPLTFLSVHLIIFCFPYFIPSCYSWRRRISKIVLFAVPPSFTLVSLSIHYNAEWCGVSYLFSWLSIPLYCTSISLISCQAGMFIFVTRQVLKHSVVFFFVLAGFSVTFYVLYHDISTEKYRNFWHTFLYTSLVLLQGDSLGDYRMISRNSTTDNTTNNGYVTYVTEALSGLRFASIITSLLFVLLVIIALLNMLVALAVRGGNELMEYGQVYHLWNQAQLLYEWYEVKDLLSRLSSKFQLGQSKEQLCDQDEDQPKDKIKGPAIPKCLRNELTCLAKCTGEKKKFNPLMNGMEAVVKEKMSALICQIEDLKESLMSEFT